jgi:hypothetical protein
VSDVADRLRTRTARAAPARPATARIEPLTSVRVSGVAGATWAMLVGLTSVVAVTVVVWAAGSHAGVGFVGAVRFGAQLWLLAHHAPLRTAGGSLAIPPLFLTIGLGLLLARASAVVARGAHCAEAGDVRAVIVSVAGPYAVLAAVLAGVARSASLRPSISSSLFTTLFVGGVAATAGAVRGSGLARSMWGDLPRVARVSLDAAGRAGVVLIGLSALVMAVSLIAHGHEFASVAWDYQGATGALSMVIFSLLLIPNAVVFSLSYLTGAGFAIGTGTSVGLGGSHLGAVPALPLLAAVPSGGAPVGVVIVCVVSVVAAGAVAGRRIATLSGPGVRGRDRLGRADQARAGLLTAAVMGLAAAVMAVMAGGAGGPGRLRAVGPSPWQLGLIVTGEVAVLAVATVFVVGVPQASRARRASS